MNFKFVINTQDYEWLYLKWLWHFIKYIWCVCVIVSNIDAIINTRTLRECRSSTMQLIIHILPRFEIWRVNIWWSRSPHNIINCSLHNGRAILKFSSKSVQNLLSNGWISGWAVSMVRHGMVQITTKIWSLVPFSTPYPSITLHRNLFITSWFNHSLFTKKMDQAKVRCNISSIQKYFANR